MKQSIIGKTSFMVLFFLFTSLLTGCGGSDSPVSSGSPEKAVYSGEWIGYGRLTAGEVSPSQWCHIDFGDQTTAKAVQGVIPSGTINLKTLLGSIAGTASITRTGNSVTVAFTDPATNNPYTVNISPDPSTPSKYVGIWKNITTNVTGTMDFIANPLQHTFPVNENILTLQGGSGTPVIFVHGMTGTNANWTAPPGTGPGWYSWLQQNSTFLNRHSVYFYQYDWQLGIKDNGQTLVSKVAALNLATPPILIGHSMGTLVSRSYIAQGGKFTKLVELAGPNNGSPLATDFWLKATGLPGQGPVDLGSNSTFIKEINANSIDIASRGSYYTWGGEMKGHFSIGAWVWDGSYNNLLKLGNLVIRAETLDEPNDGLVPKKSAFLTGTQQQPAQSCDHFQFLNPSLLPDVAAFIANL